MRAVSMLEMDLRTYYPQAFPRRFSRDHQRMIVRVQVSATSGGLYARLMSRGFGKTTIFARAMLWAVKYAHRHFGVVIGATERDSRKITKTQKSELWTNPLLIADFPEICNPYVALEDNGRRCKGQLWKGQPTRIEWATDMVVFAEIRANSESQRGRFDYRHAGHHRQHHHGLHRLSAIRQGHSTRLRSSRRRTDPREHFKSLVATEENRMQTIDGDILGLFGGETARRPP